MTEVELGKDNWITDHQKHCVSLTLDVDTVKKNIACATEEVNKFIKLEGKALDELDDIIFKIIVSKLAARLSTGKTIGLLCSGGEDSIYLLIALVKGLGIYPKLFCYETKNNSKDVKRLKKIASLWNLELYLFNSENLDRLKAYEAFIKSEKRPPNDLAQPAHNALYFQAINNHGCDIVVDGQFCDTVLLSNPQNHFLLWVKKYPALIKLALGILNYLPFKKSGKVSTRLSHLNSLIDASTLLDMMFELINLSQSDDEVQAFASQLMEKFGIQLTFAIYFFYCLLQVRERDKYILCPDLFSPFDDFSLAVISSSNIDQVLGLFVRKKPIRNICKKHFPGLFRLQNTLPFELE